MSLYLHEDITPEVIREAKKAGITGVKSYPAGVTTNSSSGVLSYEPFYPVFAEMEKQNMILNLHGEVPSTPANTHVSSSKGGAITILNAEPAFLPTFKSLHAKFPNLRIILEHCSTSAALDAGGVSVIWVDNDGYDTLPEAYRPILLTSVLKDTEQAVREIAVSTTDDSFTNEPYVGTLENEGVGLAPFHDLESSVPADLAAEVDALRDQIVAGTVTVDSPDAP